MPSSSRPMPPQDALSTAVKPPAFPDGCSLPREFSGSATCPDARSVPPAVGRPQRAEPHLTRPNLFLKLLIPPPLPAVASPSPSPPATQRLLFPSILETVQHHRAGVGRGSGISPSPTLESLGNKGSIERQRLWSVKQKPLVSTSLPLI